MFADRADAGRALAARLEHLRDQDVVVLGLPRGGVPVAWQVARALAAPLDVVVVRKLGVPGHRELAMGAVGEGGVLVLDDDVLRQARITDDDLRKAEQHQRELLANQVTGIRAGHERVELRGRTAVIVDDGLATGSTARAACAVVRALGAARVVVAVPVAPPAPAEDRAWADEFIALSTPVGFTAVGAHYRDFSATSSREVEALLSSPTRRPATLRDPPTT